MPDEEAILTRSECYVPEVLLLEVCDLSVYAFDGCLGRNQTGCDEWLREMNAPLRGSVAAWLRSCEGLWRSVGKS